MDTNNDSSNTTKDSKSHQDEHPIASAVDRLIHRARDTKLAVRTYMPIAQTIKHEEAKEIRRRIERITPLMESQDPMTRAIAQKEASEILVRFRRLSKSNVPGTIEVGLFLSLFASFDAFTGELLRALYKRKQGLFNSLNKQLIFADVLAADSLDSLKEQVLDEDIETIRRKSYTEQFATIGNKFSVNLTDFPGWPAFVECSQRRNLLTHCDGVVSEQYTKVCLEAGIMENTLPAIGTKVRIGPEYFFTSCELALEVGMKLGHTLWRKTLPDEMEQADDHLMFLLYSALESRQWERAKMIGAFAFDQRKMASDRNRKTIVVNYVQALKRSGEHSKATTILTSIDWSAASSEFRLSDLVLREQWDKAAELMHEIGPNDKLLTEHAYQTWPLFLEFRETDQFAMTYQNLFGHSYSEKLERELIAASENAAQEENRQISIDLSTENSESESPHIAERTPEPAIGIQDDTFSPREAPIVVDEE